MSKSIEFARKHGYCDIALEIEKTVCFFKLSAISSRIVGVVSKTMEFARKQGFALLFLRWRKLLVSLNYLKSVLNF